MNAGENKVIAFLLCRSGCIPYATRMVTHLIGLEVKTYASSFATETLPKDSYRLPTYRNIIEFSISSLTILPWLMIKVSSDIRKGFSTGYFPVFHPWNPFLILLFKMFKGKSLVTVHEGQLHKGEAFIWEQWLINLSIKWADGLVFLTEEEREKTKQKLCFSGKTWIINHGILSLPGLSTGPRSLPKRPAMLFMGRIIRYKGIELLLEAYALLPKNATHHLTIAGRANYKVSGQNFPGNVRWIKGWLSEKQMAQLLNEHDILILPYLEASQSGIITLGVAAGLPMICTRVGGLSEQLSENEAVWVSPEAQSLLAGMNRLITDPGLYQDLHSRLVRKREKDGWIEGARKIKHIIDLL